MCCGKDMKQFDNYINDTDYINFVCLECGHYKQIVEGQLDEETLKDYQEMEDNVKK